MKVFIDCIIASNDNLPAKGLELSVVKIILNLSRVLAYVQDGLVLSKKEGGEWAINNIDEKYHNLIKEAIICYTSAKGMNLNSSVALEFCRYMKDKIGLIEK
jgi:signal transduction histidine kinase